MKKLKSAIAIILSATLTMPMSVFGATGTQSANIIPQEDVVAVYTSLNKLEGQDGSDINPTNDTSKTLHLSVSSDDKPEGTLLGTDLDKLKYRWSVCEDDSNTYAIIPLEGADENGFALNTATKKASEITITYSGVAGNNTSNHGNAKYKIEVLDESKNIAEKIYDIKAWDITAPTAEFSETNIGQEGSVKFVPLKVTGYTDDIKTSVAPFRVLKDTTPIADWNASDTYNVSENGNYTVQVRDFAGNIIEQSYVISNINPVAPTLDYSITGTKGNMNITLDSQGTGTMSYWLSSTQTGNTYGTTTEYNLESYINGKTGIVTIYAAAKDEAGNESVKQIDLDADYLNGTLSITADTMIVTYDKSDWVNSGSSDKTVNVTANLPSVYGKYDFVSYKFGNHAASSSNKLAVTANEAGNITVTDVYGNVYTAGKYSVQNIDVTKPTIKGTLSGNNNLKLEISDSNALKKLVYVTSSKETVLEEYTTEIEGSHIFKINALGIYDFKVYDIAGNYKEFQYNAILNKDSINVDREDLTSESILGCISQTPTTWTNNNVILRIDLATEEELDAAPYNWGKGFGTSKTYEVSANGDYELIVKDIYGKEHRSGLYNVSNIDKVAPAITASANASQNTFTIVSSDSGSKLNKITIKGTGYSEETVIKDFSTVTSSINFNYLVPSNGTFIFTAYDTVGNTTTAEVVISNAVVESEELSADTLKGCITASPTEWTNDKVTLTINVNDTSIIDSTAPYKWTGQSNYSSSKSCTVSANGNYAVTVKDKYGADHTSSDYVISNIDKTTPSLSMELNDNKNIVTITMSDSASGVEKLVQMTGETETVLKEFGKTNGTGPLNPDAFSWKVPAVDSYTFRVYDVAGNYKDEIINISGSKTDNSSLYDAEQIASAVLVTPTTWTNDTVLLTLDLADKEGLAVAPYKWSNGEYSSSPSTTVSANGEYTITVKDKYGNETVSDPITIGNIDKTVPVINDPLYTNKNHNKWQITATDADSGIKKITVTPVVSGSDEVVIRDTNGAEVESLTGYYSIPAKGSYIIKAYDFAGNIKVSVAIEVTDPKVDSTELTAEGILAAMSQSPTGYTNDTVTVKVSLSEAQNLCEKPYSWNGGEYTDSKTFVVSSNGTVTLKVKDKYGAEYTSNAYHVSNIDKQAPTLTASANDKQNKISIDVSDYITDGAKDALSKIKLISVKATKASDGTEVTFMVKEYTTPVKTDSIDFVVPYNGTFEFTCEDMAGNTFTAPVVEITNATTDNVLLDNEALKGSIKSSPEQTTWTNQNVTLTLAISNTEGLVSVPYKWRFPDGSETEYSTSNSVEVSENGNYIAIVKDIYGKDNASANYPVSNIDKIKPAVNAGDADGYGIIKITASDDTTIYSSGIQKITVQSSEVEERVLKECGGSKTENNITYNTPKDGTYTVTVYDVAGNTNSTDVTVRRTKINNNALEMGSPYGTVKKDIKSSTLDWTNQAVTLTIDLEDLSGLDSKPYKWVKDRVEGEWTASNAISTKEFIDAYAPGTDENGVYFVYVKDIFGNEYKTDNITVSRIDKVAPIIDECSFSDNKLELHIEASDTTGTANSGLKRVLWTGGILSGPSVVKEYTVPVASDSGINAVVPGNGVYSVSAVDLAGNISNIVTMPEISGIKADNPLLLNPGGVNTGLTQSVKISPASWTNGNVMVVADMANKTGVTAYKWQTTCQVPAPISTDWGTNTSIAVATNGTVILSVKDAYDNVYTSEAIKIDNIDLQGPTIDLTANDEGIIIINAKDAQSGVKQISALNTDGTTNLLDYYGDPLSSTTCNYTVYTSGEYVIKAADASGNVTEKKIVVTKTAIANSYLNKEAITNSISINPTNWTDGNVTVYVTPTSTNKFATLPFRFNDGEWQKDGSYTVTENGDVTVSIKDENGNTYTSDPVHVGNIDKDKPTIKAEKTASDTSRATIKVSAADASSGIDMITVIGGDYSNESILKKYQTAEATGEENLNVTINGTYTFTVYDQVGNKEQTTVTVSGIVSAVDTTVVSNETVRTVQKLIPVEVTKPVAPTVYQPEVITKTVYETVVDTSAIDAYNNSNTAPNTIYRDYTEYGGTTLVTTKVDPFATEETEIETSTLTDQMTPLDKRGSLDGMAEDDTEGTSSTIFKTFRFNNIFIIVIGIILGMSIMWVDTTFFNKKDK